MAHTPEATTHLGAGVALYVPLQRLAHVQCDRPGHQQHVGVPRRGYEAKAEPLEIAEGVAERVDLEFAAVARACVDMPDRQGCGQARAQPRP